MYAATAAYLDARAHGGRWLLRIEDLDRPRSIPGAASSIQKTLAAFGFEWDGEVVHQSGRTALYADALEHLSRRGLLFECACSRRDLGEDARYPGTCRKREAVAGIPTGIRLRVNPRRIEFVDRIQGRFRQDVAAGVGDLLLRRRDGIHAYVLAVVVDDAAQGVTHVMRGADLLDNTPRQIYLQQELNLAEPRYAHVPVITEPDGAKLAKSRRSLRLDGSSPLPQLLTVFELLGLGPPACLREATIDEAWRWAVARWDVRRLPRGLNLRLGITAQLPEKRGLT